MSLHNAHYMTLLGGRFRGEMPAGWPTSGVPMVGRASLWIVGIGVALGALGCPARDESTPPIPDAGSVHEDAGVDAGVADAGPQSLATTVTASFADGGVQTLEPNVVMDLPSSLTLRLPKRLKDFRVRLMDHQDKVVPSDDALSADGLEYLVNPTEPLKTGRRYTVLLDAELGPVVTDEAGATFDDWELPFTIAGDVQPDPAQAKSAKTGSKPKAKKRR